MRKTLVIAARDYLAAVRTKSFVISLILMPVLIAGSMLVSRFSRSVVDTTPKKVAVIDHTAEAALAGTPATRPAASTTFFGSALTAGLDRLGLGGAADAGGRPLYQVIIEEAEERNAGLLDPETGKSKKAPLLFEWVPLADGSEAALAEARLELSDRVREGELFAFIEVGGSIFGAPPEEIAESAAAALAALQGADGSAEEDEEDGPAGGLASLGQMSPEAMALLDRYGVRYTSKSTTNQEVQGWLRETLTPVVYQRRLAAAGVPPGKVLDLVVPPAVQQRALAVRADDGAIRYEEEPNVLAGFLVPIFMVFLLFTLLGAAVFPLTTNIIEEKQLRIAEVLLGSVRPFDLMLGKLLGGVGVTLTLALIYLGGGLVVAEQFDALSLIGPAEVAWFVVFAILATLMVGAAAVAAGAAVTNLKEAQNIQTPLVLLPMVPLFVAGSILPNPNGPLAKIFTWFPLTTPMTATMRLGVPDGIGTAERVGAAALCVVTTLVLVWLAGRIFRYGMLRNDTAAAFRDVVRWVTRG